MEEPSLCFKKQITIWRDTVRTKGISRNRPSPFLRKNVYFFQALFTGQPTFLPHVSSAMTLYLFTPWTYVDWHSHWTKVSKFSKKYSLMRTTASTQWASKLHYCKHTPIRIFYHSDVAGLKIVTATLNVQSKAQGFEKQLKNSVSVSCGCLNIFNTWRQAIMFNLQWYSILKSHFSNDRTATDPRSRRFCFLTAEL